MHVERVLIVFFLWDNLSMFSSTPLISDEGFSDVEDELNARAAVNRDIRYDVWPNPRRILYRLDDAYDETEKVLIKDAMTQISEDMSSCIRFAPYNFVTDSREDHIFISPTLNHGIPPATCVNFPGRVVRQNGAGQKLVIFRTDSGGGGCLNSKRETMAIIFPLLGQRMELNRPDRDLYVRVFPENISPAFRGLGVLKKNQPVSVEASEFDLLSITMPHPGRFALPNTPLYVPLNPFQRIGNFARLSRGDCMGIKRNYPSCMVVRCSDPYGTSGRRQLNFEPSSELPISTIKRPASHPFSMADLTPPDHPSRNRLVSASPISTLFDTFDNSVRPRTPHSALEFWLDSSLARNSDASET